MRWSETLDTIHPSRGSRSTLRRTIHQLTNKIRFAFLPGCIGRCVVPFGNARTYGIYISRAFVPSRFFMGF